MASYNKFNYTYRPSKSVERKLFIELLKEIYGVVDAKKCTYIGFGSIFFADFKMMHRELGIKSMINIEANEEDRKRFEFNRPFACIKLLWGTSTEVLSDIEWEGKKIIWMDYDQTLQPYMFEDIEIIFSNIEPGSFYLLSCNSSFPKFRQNTGVYNLEAFQAEFESLTPFGMTAEMLTTSKSPELLRQMISNQINHILEQRNAILDNDDKLKFCQLLFITYKDNAPMFSLGGMILRNKEVKNLKDSGILSLPYVKPSNDRLDIQTPVLTNSEIDLINGYLPKNKAKFLGLSKLRFIPEEDKNKYYSVYRYYPSFVEIRDF